MVTAPIDTVTWIGPAGVSTSVLRAAENFFGRRGQFVLWTLTQDNAKTIAVKPTDDIGRAQALVKPVTERDNDRIGDVIAEGLVYDIDIVDADNEKRALNLIAATVIQCLVERFAQTGLVKMAGEFVIIRQILDFIVVGFLLTDRAQRPKQPDCPALRIEFRRTPVVIPMVLPVGASQAKFVREGCVPRPQRCHRIKTKFQIFGMNSGVKLLYRADAPVP